MTCHHVLVGGEIYIYIHKHSHPHVALYCTLPQILGVNMFLNTDIASLVFFLWHVSPHNLDAELLLTKESWEMYTMQLCMKLEEHWQFKVKAFTRFAKTEKVNWQICSAAP